MADEKLGWRDRNDRLDDLRSCTGRDGHVVRGLEAPMNQSGYEAWMTRAVEGPGRVDRWLPKVQ